MNAVAKKKPKSADPPDATPAQVPPPPGPSGGRTTAPIQIEMELARMAAVIASHDRKTVSALMSPVVRQFLLTNYERVRAEIANRIETMQAEDQQAE